MNQHIAVAALALLGGCGILGPTAAGDTTAGKAAGRAHDQALAVQAKPGATEDELASGLQAADACIDGVTHELDRTHHRVEDSLPTAHGPMPIITVREECVQARGTLDELLHPHILPVIVAWDERLQHDALEDLRAQSTNGGWTESWTAVILTTSDWQMQRHPDTGVLTGRSRSAVAVGRRTDSTCVALPMTITEEHDGSRFLEVVRVTEVFDKRTMSCKSLTLASRKPDRL